MNRGLYFFDETYYMYTYADPAHYAISLTGASHLIHKLFGWLHPDLLMYRYLHLWLDILGAVVFYLGFHSWFSAVFPDKKQAFWTPGMVFFFCIIANMVSGFRYPQSISYYSLTNFCMLCVASGVFGFLAAKSDSKRQSLAALLLAGLGTGLVLIIRFPTGLLLTVLSLLCVILKTWLGRAGLKPGFANTLMYGVGLILGLGFYFTLIQLPQDFVAQYWPLYQMLSQGSHSLTRLLRDYGVAFLTLLNIFIEYYGWILLLWMVLIRKVKKSSRFSGLYEALYAAFPVVFLAIGWIDQLHYPLYSHSKVFWVMLVCAAVWALPGLLARRAERTLFWSGCVVLFLLPLVSAFGTDISILQVMYTAILPWLALFLILVATFPAEASDGKIDALRFPDMRRILTGLMLIFIALHAWFELILNPATPSAEGTLPQTETVMQLPRLNGLLVSPVTKDYLLRLKQLLNRAHFQPGDTLLSLHRIPGLSYIFEGVPFGGGYYLSGSSFDKENCFYLQKTGVKAPLPTALLINSKPSPGFNRCLEAAGLYIARDYQRVGTVYTPVNFYSQGTKSITEIDVYQRRTLNPIPR